MDYSISSHIVLESIPNARDLGGILTEEGKCIVPKRLIRSGALAGITVADQKVLVEQYQLKRIVDFRTNTEVEEKPDPVLEGVDYRHNPILGEKMLGISTEKGTVKALYLQIAKEKEKQTIAKQYMMEMYKKIIHSDYAKAQYAQFFNILLEAKEGATLWHCSAGKDRVGIGTMLLLSSLGVSKENIMADYLYTNELLKDEVEKIIGRMKSQLIGQLQGDEKAFDEAVGTVFSVDESYMQAVWLEIEETYGSIEAYLREGIGLTKEKEQRLKAQYLMPI